MFLGRTQKKKKEKNLKFQSKAIKKAKKRVKCKLKNSEVKGQFGAHKYERDLVFKSEAAIYRKKKNQSYISLVKMYGHCNVAPEAIFFYLRRLKF